MTNSNKMHRLSRAFGFAFALCVSALSGEVVAQAAASHKLLCSPMGAPSTWEPVGDRAGHNIQVTRTTCRVEGGPLDGGLVAVNGTWEYDGPNGALLSGDGVIRKSGALAAVRATAGTLVFTMKDGAPTGWTASGKGAFTMASGSAAALAGKTYSWTARPTGPGQSIQEWVMD